MCVKCPVCKEEIDMLNNFQSGEQKSIAFLGGYDDMDYENDDFVSDDGTNEYECPECREVLATNEEDAIEILKGVKK